MHACNTAQQEADQLAMSAMYCATNALQPLQYTLTSQSSMQAQQLVAECLQGKLQPPSWWPVQATTYGEPGQGLHCHLQQHGPQISLDSSGVSTRPTRSRYCIVTPKA